MKYTKKEYFLEHQMLEQYRLCKTHGLQKMDKFVKAGLHKSGYQLYKCRACLKVNHRNHYLSNKEKIKEAHLKYREENREKYLKIKNISHQKLRENPEFKEKEKKRWKEYASKNPIKIAERQNRFKRRSVELLLPSYVLRLLKKGEKGLTLKNTPEDLIKLKREHILLKRVLKEMQSDKD